MLDDALRRRLEDLNRGPLPGGNGAAGQKRIPPGTKGEMKQCWRNGSSQSSGTGDPFRPFHFTSDTASLTSNATAGRTAWLEIGEVVETSGGRHLRIVQPVEAIWKNGERLVAARHGILTQAIAHDGNASGPKFSEYKAQNHGYRGELYALMDAFPDRAMFLDLETCGLAGAALFLIGLLRRMDGRLAVELLLARNYAEEKAVLVSLWERAVAHDVLVTFNGKSFDWPMILDRSTRHLLGNGQRPELIHFDILHHARRRWRSKLPNCKLQTLERTICGRRRQADIPGAGIPAAYQRFVERGDPREMESILWHNAHDLVTLLDLSMRLAGNCSEREGQAQFAPGPAQN